MPRFHQEEMMFADLEPKKPVPISPLELKDSTNIPNQFEEDDKTDEAEIYTTRFQKGSGGGRSMVREIKKRLERH